MNLWKTCLAIAAVTLLSGEAMRAADPVPEGAQTLYPFVRDGKWGFIDSRGEWVIEPRFDGAHFLFEKERVRVEQGNRWGYINRQGEWLIKPQFTDPYFGSNTPAFEVVHIGKQCGILKPSAEVLLPAHYDEIALLEDRAFVRRGEKLGVFGFDGRWIKPLSVPWPKGREMPAASANRAAWFKQGRNWGLISRDGAILFRPQFAEHQMGRRESEEWDHPEGLDFKGERTWVTRQGEYWLITDDGKVLARQPFLTVSHWSDLGYVFRDKANKAGLISREGVVLAPAEYDEIGELREGLALVKLDQWGKDKSGERVNNAQYGFIGAEGKTVVPLGTYQGVQPISEGLSAVWNERRADGQPGPGAGFIDTTGREVVPLTYGATESFKDGLAKVTVVMPGKPHDVVNYFRIGFIDKTGREIIPPVYWHGESPSEGLIPVSAAIPGSQAIYYYHFLWGFADYTGRELIAPQFGWTSPFSQGYAWVLKASADPAEALWALIDREGRVLTDYAYRRPPQSHTYDDHGNEQRSDNRWRGHLVVLARGEFELGLATTNGKVLVPPQFNRISEFHDGIAVAIDSRQYPKFATALITSEGIVFAYDEYTEITDFDGGVAWASKRYTDHRSPYLMEGWGLIDKSAKPLTDLNYVSPSWMLLQSKYTGNNRPQFCGALAPVAWAEGYNPYQKNAALKQGWGYVNRTGRIIAWHNAEAVSSSR